MKSILWILMFHDTNLAVLTRRPQLVPGDVLVAPNAIRGRSYLHVINRTFAGTNTGMYGFGKSGRGDEQDE